MKKVFHFCDACNPTRFPDEGIRKGSRLTTTSSEFPFCSAGRGHFSKTIYTAEVNVKHVSTNLATDPTQSRNGGDYHFDNYIVIDENVVDTFDNKKRRRG